MSKCDCGNKVNTNLKCGDSECQNFICPKCMVHTKTVPKCKKCAKLKKNPAFNPSPKELILSFTVCSTASITISIGINATLNIINNVAPGIIVFYLLLLVPPLLGWAIGNIIERTSRYKKSKSRSAKVTLCTSIIWYISCPKAITVLTKMITNATSWICFTMFSIYILL